MERSAAGEGGIPSHGGEGSVSRLRPSARGCAWYSPGDAEREGLPKTLQGEGSAPAASLWLTRRRRGTAPQGMLGAFVPASLSDPDLWSRLV
jgi:hypothetical protein